MTSTSRAWATGGVLFAGTLMLLSGLFNIFEGIMALARQHVYLTTPNYTFKFTTTSWGWIHLILGAVVGLVGPAQRTRGDVGAQHPPQGAWVVAQPFGLDGGARDLARRIGNPRHVRTAVPVGVVSTIQPAAWSWARIASARA